MQKSEHILEPFKIHIAFNSREDKRITQPIIKYRPNKLYYFVALIKKTGQRDEHMNFYEKNVACIKVKNPSIDIIKQELDYTNYIEILQKLSLIIKTERELNPNCTILINIGTGSKITALASTEASRLWNCKILYVHSTKYDPLIEGAEHKGKMITFEPHIFPLQKPAQKLIEVLKIVEIAIKEKYNGKEVKSTPLFIYKKDLIQILRDKGYLTLKSKHINPRFQ